MFQAKLLLMAIFAVLATAEYQIEPRIVQGLDAVRGQFPFYVFLQILVPEGLANCGGSLISDEWVVTAAHCLRNAMQTTVNLGSLKAADYGDNFGDRVIYEVGPENMHIHPKFSLLLAWNDIGLIKLPKPVTFSDVIKPISFACSPSSDSGMDVIAIGNGMTKNNDTALPKILQYTEQKTISTLSCLKTFPYLVFRKSFVCVKGEEKRSACHGDSGGPLIHTSDNVLLGLTSFGSRKGCEEGAPQVFTKIVKYEKWIEDVSGVKCKN